MPTPSITSTPGAMSAPDFDQWLAELRDRGIASSDAAAARILGRSEDTVRRMKERGADRTTALACAAILKNLKPYGNAKELTP